MTDTDTALRTDTPEQQAAHYPETTRRRSNPMPDRAAWTIRHRTPYSEDVDNARDRVSDAATAHADPQEIEAAIGELDALWKSASTLVRAANKQARAAFPLHSAAPRGTLAVKAWYAAYDALTDEQRAVVEHARSLTDSRKHLHELAAALRRGHLDRFAAHRAADLLTAQNCPVYARISDRHHAARDQAAEQYKVDVAARPIDDEAWAKELLRREKNEAFFRNGPVVRIAAA